MSTIDPYERLAAHWLSAPRGHAEERSLGQDHESMQERDMGPEVRESARTASLVNLHDDAYQLARKGIRIRRGAKLIRNSYCLCRGESLLGIADIHSIVPWVFAFRHPAALRGGCYCAFGSMLCLAALPLLRSLGSARAGRAGSRSDTSLAEWHTLV